MASTALGPCGGLPVGGDADAAVIIGGDLGGGGGGGAQGKYRYRRLPATASATGGEGKAAPGNAVQ